MTNTVTVMGLGLMGTALAEAFLKDGHTTTVWNRSAHKADPLVAQGAAKAATANDAIAASPLVVLCLSVNENVREVLEAAGDTLTGRVIVNLTNGTPRQARELAELVTARGGEYVDGGIMAIPPMISQPEALILYSGSRRAFDTYKDQLGSLGAAQYVGTDAGLAALYDLGLLTAMYGMFAGYYHAVALLRTEGVKASEFTPMVHSWVTAMMASLPRQAEHIDSGDYLTDVSSLTNNAAGFPNLTEASREQGVSPELLTPLQALLDRAVAEGHGADSPARLVELLGAQAR